MAWRQRSSGPQSRRSCASRGRQREVPKGHMRTLPGPGSADTHCGNGCGDNQSYCRSTADWADRSGTSPCAAAIQPRPAPGSAVRVAAATPRRSARAMSPANGSATRRAVSPVTAVCETRIVAAARAQSPRQDHRHCANEPLGTGVTLGASSYCAKRWIRGRSWGPPGTWPRSRPGQSARWARRRTCSRSGACCSSA